MRWVHQWLLQMEAYLETQCLTSNEWIHFAQTFLKDHAWDWWMAQKQKTSNLLEILTWEKFKLHLNEIFMPHHYRQDGTLGVHSRGWSKSFGPSCIRVYHKTNFYSLQKGINKEVGFFAHVEAFGLKINLPRERYFKYMSKVDHQNAWRSMVLCATMVN